jgi:glycosyltransferase involved in cell wall biosynthesis
MKISVAIATYNRAAMVGEAIDAALAQSLAPHEIVISDDASTDGTAESLDQITNRDPRVRVLRQPVNTGGVENWNAAMRATTGDYIAWCSDDDHFTSDHLAASVAFLQNHPDIGLVHSSFIDSIETESGCEQTPRPLRSTTPIIVNSRNLIRYMTRYYNWPFHPSTLVMRREIWQRTGEFNPAYALADTDWFVRAASITSIAMLPRHGVINRRHPGNWSNRVGSANMQREIFEIVDKNARGIWRTLWRANVRAHLVLTIRARLASGHGDAACAAWNTLLQHTGRKSPRWMEDLGARWIARHSASKDASTQIVSPL